MNKVLLTGRLVRDPEVRYTNSGKCYCQFTIAVDRPFANADGTRTADFPSCAAWDKSAEFVGNHFSKGKWIEVEGRMQTRSYEAQDGSKRSVTEVAVEKVGFVGAKEQSSPKAAAQPSHYDGMGQQLPFDEEIPF